jgi:hypothetical protein
VPVVIVSKQVHKTREPVILRTRAAVAELNGNFKHVANVHLALMILAVMANGVAVKVAGEDMTITKVRQIASYGDVVAQHVAVCTGYSKIIVTCHQARNQNVILGTIFIICAVAVRQVAIFRLIVHVTGAAPNNGLVV